MRKTVFVLRFLDDDAYRRRIGQELNKGERSHALSRFLFFGKEGAVRENFQDQRNTFACLAVLHNAVVVWNTLRLGEAVAGLRAEGDDIPDRELARTSPLLHAHINPFGHIASTWPGCAGPNPGFQADVAVSSRRPSGRAATPGRPRPSRTVFQ